MWSPLRQPNDLDPTTVFPRPRALAMATTNPPCTCKCGAPEVTGAFGDVTLGLHLRDLRLVFAVSSDEEYVRLRVSCGPSTFDLGARKHNYLLLTLARRRLSEASGLAENNSGWVHQEELDHDPAMVGPKLNMDVFRIRRQFIERHVIDGSRVVERRPQTRELRLGTAQIAIATL
ncbi:MAG: hypothetical protein M3O36_05030 [Myxococcota bacterium]|nr:hypothetical protein [Myxococcota bacterium]